MDQVSRVLGGESPMGDPVQAFNQANEQCANLAPSLAQYESASQRLMHQISEMTHAIDTLRSAYENVTRERQDYSARLQQADARLAEVSRVVQRYIVVQNPVVASDGFTYERDTIRRYLDDCKASNTTPISQQTQGNLTPVLIPNQSLKKLLENLKTISSKAAPRPAEQRPAPERTGVPSTTGTPSLHPCLRVYGYCNYKDNCTYAQYPYDACLSHLKGKCRFGTQCHELHVEARDTGKHK